MTIKKVESYNMIPDHCAPNIKRLNTLVINMPNPMRIGWLYTWMVIFPLRGKYPGAPPHVREKKRGKNKPTARYLIDQYGERGKVITKKKSNLLT
jgi:hypothetical protein